MPETYEVTAVREITDVNDAGDLLDYLEASAKTKPHGVHFSVRVPAGTGAAADLQGQLASKAGELESVYGTD